MTQGAMSTLFLYLIYKRRRKKPRFAYTHSLILIKLRPIADEALCFFLLHFFAHSGGLLRFTKPPPVDLMRVPDVGVFDMPLLPSAGAHINSKNLRTPLNNRNRWDLKNQLWHLKLSNSSQGTPAASSASQLTASEKHAQFGENTSGAPRCAPREVHLHDPRNLAVRPPPRDSTQAPAHCTS